VADIINPSGVPLVNSQNNQQEVVPWDQAHQALTSGSHNLQAGQTVNVTNPDGQLVSLPSEQIPDALQAGYALPKQATVNEYNNQQTYGEGPENEAKAALAGAGRGATLGLSDVALTKLGLVSPNTLEQLRERNPISDIAGNIAGIGASLLVPGSPVAQVGKLGEAATEAAAPVASSIARSLANPETSPIVAKILAGVGNVGAKTLGSAVEGSVYGLGNAVTENALGDADLNAENILHNVGYGALFGGALGATFGTAGETYDLLRGTFGKEAAQAAAKDAIIENGALSPTPQNIEPPTSLEEIKRHIENAATQGYGEELPAKSRLLETNDILAGDSSYPAHSLQIQSLSSPTLRDSYKAALENPQNVDGQTLRTWEAVQKSEGANKLLPNFIQQISPESSLTNDAVQGGNQGVDAFINQYKKEQIDLKPAFNYFDKQAATIAADPTAVLNKIEQAIPDSSKYIIKDPDGYQVAKYTMGSPLTKEAHDAISGLFEELNKPEGATLSELRNVRTKIANEINWSKPSTANVQLSNLKRSLMDLIQDEIQKNAPATETVEGLNHPLKSPLSDPREMMKRWAINEENRSVMEHIFGGSITDKDSFVHEIKREEILDRIFGNTVNVKAAKEILGADFDKLTANYLSERMARVTDPAKNGFSSNKFATFLRQKGPELEEALREHPEQLKKIQAVTDKMRILPDSPSINTSGTAKTSLLQRMQHLSGYLGKDGIMSIPGKVMSAAGEAFGEMQQHSEFNRILRSNTDMGSPEQLANKTRQYGGYSRIERMQQLTNNTIEKGANALLKARDLSIPAAVPKLIPKEKQLDNYNKLQTHLKDMTSNPEHFVDTLQKSTSSLHDIAPNINSSLTMAAVRATQFLQSKLPNQNPSSPLTKPYEPSSSELARFNRYVSAVEHPLNVLKHMKTGDLTSETLETLHTVYPKLLSQMQQAVTDKLNEKTIAKMPYQTKIMVSAFLGTDLDNSLHQPNIAAAQITSAPPPQPHPTPKQKVNPSQKGLGKLDRSQQFMTPQQQSAQRSDT